MFHVKTCTLTTNYYSLRHILYRHRLNLSRNFIITSDGKNSLLPGTEVQKMTSTIIYEYISVTYSELNRPKECFSLLC